MSRRRPRLRLRKALPLFVAAIAPAASEAALADGCAPEGPRIAFAACAGEAAVEILLLPEDAALVAEAPPGALTVTGAYTATDKRDGKAKPVGVFIRGGERVSLELARMDGLLIVEADGTARIVTVEDARLGGVRHDLGVYEGRAAFAEAARAAGASALQSHLLIRDGALDVRPVEDAPRAGRRLLFETEDGALGVWDGGAAPMTLHEAAEALMAEASPRMALNLDMGSYDFCERTDKAGKAESCGVVGREATAWLSNLIRLRRR